MRFGLVEVVDWVAWRSRVFARGDVEASRTVKTNDAAKKTLFRLTSACLPVQDVFLFLLLSSLELSDPTVYSPYDGPASAHRLHNSSQTALLCSLYNNA